MSEKDGPTILCHRLHTGGGKWCWVDGAPNEQCLADARNFGWELELAYAAESDEPIPYTITPAGREHLDGKA